MSAEGIFNVIVECTLTVLPSMAGRRFKRDDRLAELGANSVDRADIVMMVLERLSLRIPLTEVYGPRNIGELADLLHAKLSSS